MEGTRPLLAATQIYPLLEANTQQIMDYYDTHRENAIDRDNWLELQTALATRFALKDKLIVLIFDNNLKASVNDDTLLARPA